MKKWVSDLPLDCVVNIPTDRSDRDRLPLVIIMHGLGADGSDLVDIAPALDGHHGFRFVFPTAPHRWESAPGLFRGYKWFEGWPPEGASQRQSRKMMLEFLDAVAQRYPPPKGKVVISGFSQGALMALDVGYRTQQKIAAIVAMSGGLNENDLPDFSAHKDVPVLLVHGVNDDVVRVHRARQTRVILESQGIFPDYWELATGHYLTRESIAVVADFVRRHLSRRISR